MYQQQNAIVELNRVGKRACEIVRILKTNRQMVYRTLKRYNESGSTNKRYGGGRAITATSPSNVKKVRERLRRNPHRSARKMSRELQISERSVRRILKNKIHMFPYKIQKVHELTSKKKATRLERVKSLKRRHVRGELNNLVFSDEKLFTIQQFVNKQNDRVWATSRSSINSDYFRATRTQGAASVMVWAAISATGRTPLVFVPSGVKVNAQMYLNNILIESLKPWADDHYGGRSWVFQQDSAPAHKARIVQTWLRENVPDFISTQDWPPYSPDLNPLDFSVWSILESKVSTVRHASIKSLKATLIREWNRIPQNVLRDCVAAFSKRLAMVVKARGGYIEQ